MGDPANYDDAAYRLVGKIIVDWSEIHEFIHGQIGHPQTQIHLRNKRHWMAQNPTSFYPHFTVGRQVPDSRFRLKLRYFSRLVKACDKDNKTLAIETDKITGRTRLAYETRNVMAHGTVYVSGYLEKDPHITVRYREWEEAWFKRANTNMRSAGKFPSPRDYSFVELESWIAEMRDLKRAIWMLVARLPHFGPPVGEAPQKPS